MNEEAAADDFFTSKQPIIALSDDPDRQATMTAACRLLDLGRVQGMGIDRALGDGLPPAALLFIDGGSILERPAQDLSVIVKYCHDSDAQVVVWTPHAADPLDRLYSELSGDRTHFIVGDNASDVLLVLNQTGRQQTMGKVFDHSKDKESVALTRMSDELAQFARTLSRIARQEAEGEDLSHVFADSPVSFRPMPSAWGQDIVRAASPIIHPDGIDPAAIRAIIRQRRLRDKYFQAELFADPAWDILLDLMAARLEGQNVSVSSLCIAAAVPATTALRWIKAMTDDGLLVRHADPTDARRVYISLSDEAASAMTQYLKARLGIAED